MMDVHGWKFPDGDEFMASQMDSGGNYQRRHLEVAMEYVRSRRTAVDGGAHVGTWSVPMSLAFDRVVAFEPSADTLEALRENVAGRARPDVVEVQHAALGQREGRVRMTLDGFDRAIKLKNLGARFVAPGSDVRVMTLDSLDIEDLDFLKLDVEGSEVDALMGAQQTLQRCRPVVLFEDKNLWSRYGYERHAPHKLLLSLGARQHIRVKMDEVWGWD